MEICLPVWQHRAFIDGHRYDHESITTLLLVTTEETRLEDLISRKVTAGDIGAVANTVLLLGREKVGLRVGPLRRRRQAPRQRDERRDRGVPRRRAGARLRLIPAEHDRPGRRSDVRCVRAELERARDVAFRRVPRAGSAASGMPSPSWRRSGSAPPSTGSPTGSRASGRRSSAGATRGGRAAPTTTPAWGSPGSSRTRLPARRPSTTASSSRGRPVLVALDLFPAFYALVRGPPARPRLPRRVRGGAPVPRGEAAHGRPDPPAPALHAGVARRGAHAGARLDARVRARGGGAPAGRSSP